jgi:hypothetical protein
MFHVCFKGGFNQCWPVPGQVLEELDKMFVFGVFASSG